MIGTWSSVMFLKIKHVDFGQIGIVSLSGTATKSLQKKILNKNGLIVLNNK